jgi:hypothetical protein
MEGMDFKKAWKFLHKRIFFSDQPNKAASNGHEVVVPERIQMTKGYGIPC